jgi:hypothetical protein
MSHVMTLVSGRLVVAELVHEHQKTVLVRLRDGSLIKRHRVKHAVRAIGPE